MERLFKALAEGISNRELKDLTCVEPGLDVFTRISNRELKATSQWVSTLAVADPCISNRELKVDEPHGGHNYGQVPGRISNRELKDWFLSFSATEGF